MSGIDWEAWDKAYEAAWAASEHQEARDACREASALLRDQMGLAASLFPCEMLESGLSVYADRNGIALPSVMDFRKPEAAVTP